MTSPRIGGVAAFCSRNFLRFYSMAALFLLAVLALASPPASVTAIAQETTPGAPTTITVAPSARLSWDEMLELEARTPMTPREPRVVPWMPGPGPQEIFGEPVLPPPSAPTPPSPDELESLGPFALVETMIALEDNNTSIPPDTMGAVGPNHLMTMLNTQVRIQDKSGIRISTVTLDTFWSGIVGDPFDPKLIFDTLSDRWLSTVDLDGNSSTSGIGFAISSSSDPTGVWTFYKYDADAANTTWADFPGFGVNNTWIAITNNMFTVSASPTYQGTKMWVIDKATALAGTILTVNIFAPGFSNTGFGNGFTLKPVETSSPMESTLYLLDSGWSTATNQFLRLSQITGTGAAPSWSVATGGPFPGSGVFTLVNAYNPSMIEASQPGTGTTIDTGDPRMTDPKERNGMLYAVHSGALPAAVTPDRTAAFWYEIDPTKMSTSPIVQSGVLDPGSGSHYSYPSIAANKDNDIAIGFSHSNSTTYIREMATGRVSTDPAGTMRVPYEIAPGQDSYVKIFSGTRVRWGDYSATSVDPSDDTTFWSIQQRAVMDVGPGASDDRWETNWSKNKRALDLFLGDEEDEDLATAFRAYLERIDLGWLVTEEHAPQ